MAYWELSARDEARKIKDCGKCFSQLAILELASLLSANFMSEIRWYLLEQSV